MMRAIAAAVIASASGEERLYFNNLPRDQINSIDFTQAANSDALKASLTMFSDYDKPGGVSGLGDACCFDVDSTGTMFYLLQKSKILYRLPYGASAADAEIVINDMGVETVEWGSATPHCSFSMVNGKFDKVYWSHGRDSTALKVAPISYTGMIDASDVTTLTMDVLGSIPCHVHHSSSMNKLFWSDARSSSRGIYMCDIDGSNAKQVVNTGLVHTSSMPAGMSSVGNDLYFTDKSHRYPDLSKVTISDTAAYPVAAGELVPFTKEYMNDVDCKDVDADTNYVRCYLCNSGRVASSTTPDYGGIFYWAAGTNTLSSFYQPESSQKGINLVKLIDVTIPTTITSSTATVTASTKTVTTTTTATAASSSATNTSNASNNGNNNNDNNVATTNVPASVAGSANVLQALWSGQLLLSAALLAVKL